LRPFLETIIDDRGIFQYNYPRNILEAVKTRHLQRRINAVGVTQHNRN